ncbi:cytochrome P450 [Crucibulum laeve]|uniref:Cytochrome P450 n=1 Tax=Crucibulum laeve TaxID=68775 RepID=A0A5C3M4Q5_9AGAR|nr:cytochrome P450 [Crucibulum laeve]
MDSLVDNHPFLLFAIVAAVTLHFHGGQGRKLKHIPAIGSESPILSFFYAFKFFFNSTEMVKEGYDKHKGGAFRIPGFTTWMIFFNSPKLIEELRKVPDDIMSFTKATEEALQVPYTLGAQISENDYHVPIVRNQLTRNLGAIFPELHDEIVASFQDVIPPSDEWKKYPIQASVLQIVGRTSNRTFVGLPLCRNQEFIDIGIQVTMDVTKLAMFLNILPAFLRPIAAVLLSTISSRVKQASKLLAPVIEDHRKRKEQYGEDMEQPNDFLSWLLDEANEEEQTVDKLTSRILAMNFAAIHTTTITFNQALLNLAAAPQYLKPLRAEVEEVTRAEGWSKASLDKMRHLDSFFRETQRLHPLGCITATRKALEDHMFYNNTFIPKGFTVSLPAEATMLDEAFYSNPEEFDPFRFSKVNVDQGSRRVDMVSVSNEYLPFGHGKHVCPGRFFAANEVKLMMAHLILTYDIKLENEGVRPPDLCIATARIPNVKAEVMFRKRAA